MKHTKKRNDEELNFWQPTSDLMSGLMYILMLVILLLGLHLMQLPEHQELDQELGDSYYEYPSPTPTLPSGGEGDYEGEDRENDDDGGDYNNYVYVSISGGEGGRPSQTPVPSPSPTPTPTPSPTPTPVPGSGGVGNGTADYRGHGEEDEPGLKAAVHVTMVDATTDLPVMQDNVEFELYLAGGALQTLNSYYPERATYRYFLTTPAGSFFFPEKLDLGEYELHELTEPEGYDAADNVVFLLDDAYDWSDPYVVQVPMLPSQNIIRVQLLDLETGANISGGSFEVFAADNIITQDGTVRFHTAQLASEILCGASGYGESEELFLGQYYLRQLTIPEYYASCREDIRVAVEKKSSALPAIVPVYCERTRININVMDELYESRVVDGAVFSITPSRGLPFTLTSDHMGKLRIENISKDTIYRIVQTAAPGHYLLNPAEYTISVSADGRINGESSVELNLRNRMIRVSIGLTDEFSDVQIPGVRMSVYNAKDELLHEWITTSSAQNYEDLAPGTYYVLIGDDTTRHDILVRDQAEIQRFNVSSSFFKHYLLYSVIGLILLLALLVFRFYMKKKKAAAASEME